MNYIRNSNTKKPQGFCRGLKLCQRQMQNPQPTQERQTRHNTAATCSRRFQQGVRGIYPYRTWLAVNYRTGYYDEADRKWAARERDDVTTR